MRKHGQVVAVMEKYYGNFIVISVHLLGVSRVLSGENPILNRNGMTDFNCEETEE